VTKLVTRRRVPETRSVRKEGNASVLKTRSKEVKTKRKDFTGKELVRLCNTHRVVLEGGWLGKRETAAGKLKKRVGEPFPH